MITKAKKLPILAMNQTSALIMLCTFVLLTSSYAGAQANAAESQPEIAVSVRPSIAIVIGVFSITFSLTFLLLVYTKFCSHSASNIFAHDAGSPQTDARRSSGINKSVIQSLPFFRFAALKGSKDGLECSVCLSKFEDEDTLRLLPKCGHGFHIDCVDRWLENHSSCPLCRCEVKAEDVAVFNYSNSSRFLIRDSSFVVENEFELFVERELDNDAERRRVGRKMVESLLPETGSERRLMHKVKHKIIVPDVVFRNRWSDLNSSDLTSLNSDMLNVMSSQRFAVWSPESDALSTVKLETERSESLMNKSINPNPVGPTPSISSERRSFSEITVLSRSSGPRYTTTDDGGTDENLRRVWLTIARRTLRSFARRGKRPDESCITPDQPRITIKVET